MQYIELVNKTIQESGSEIDELTLATWDTAVAGRRIYPRIKRYVADAWKMLQIKRNEWEFRATEVSTVVYPRMKFSSGDNLLLGETYIGQDSGFELTASLILVDSGALVDGNARGQVEFVDYVESSPLPVPGEVFQTADASSSFVYESRGSYDFGLEFTDLNQIQWTTMISSYETYSPLPLIYVPYDNFATRNYYYSGGFMTPPSYVSQDPQGKVVFYSQTLKPFRVSFWYDKTPHQLILPTDIPESLPPQYHEVLAWDALALMARYDKNPDLFAHAEISGKPFRDAIEKNLMPPVQWAGNRFNE